MTKKVRIGNVDKGHCGMPGQDYSERIARVYLVRPGRYELYVRSARGSNQGRLEEHGRVERSYRADSLAELLALGIREVRADAELDDDGRIVAAIREACAQAEDVEATALAAAKAAALVTP